MELILLLMMMVSMRRNASDVGPSGVSSCC
jgi:hypothetical protein